MTWMYVHCVSADYIFTPDQKFLAALLCLCSISHCWRGGKTKMHLDRGHLTWPQTRRDLAAAVYSQNKSTYFTKSLFVYKSRVQSVVDIALCLYQL